MWFSGAPFVENVWTAAHAAARFPRWEHFQVVAVVLGGALLVREGGRRFLAPYLAGIVLAIVGAVALGTGAGLAGWIAGGRSGPAPDVELAGFGAIAGLTLGYVLVSRLRGMAAAPALDALAPSIGAMLAVARLGCFFAGCDFGAPSHVPWALRYPVMTPALRAQIDRGFVASSGTHTLPVHPTQLYEASIGVIVLVVALAWRAPRRAGGRFAVALLLYAAGRFVVDHFRGDLAHGGSLGLTTTQGLAIALAGLIVAWRALPLVWASDADVQESSPPDDPPSSPEGPRDRRPTVAS